MLKTHVDHANQTLRVSSNGSSSSKGNAYSQPLPISFHLQGGVTDVGLPIEIAGLTIVVLLAACAISCLMHCFEYEAEAPTEAEDSTCRLESSKEGHTQSSAAVGSKSPPPKSKEMLAGAVDGNDGTWAYNYRVAEGKQKEALELLFRCGIIPQHEFACSRVSQDHIDECMWVSMHMLRQRPLEEWVTLSPEAQQMFEESVSCFTGRTGAQPGTARPDLPAGSSPDGPYEGIGHAVTTTYPVTLAVKTTESTESSVVQSTDDSGQNLLFMRCRELMAARRPEAEQQDGTGGTDEMPLHLEAAIRAMQSSAMRDDFVLEPQPLQKSETSDA